MSAIDEFRHKMSQFAAEHINLLGEVADTEQRLNRLKKDITESYGKIDDLLDLDIKKD